jgi:hypothetical protein
MHSYFVTQLLLRWSVPHARLPFSKSLLSNVLFVTAVVISLSSINIPFLIIGTPFLCLVKSTETDGFIFCVTVDMTNVLMHTFNGKI